MQRLPNSNSLSRQPQVPSPTPASQTASVRPQATKTPKQKVWKFVKKYGLFAATPWLTPLPGLAALAIGKARKAQRLAHKPPSYQRLSDSD